jgi:hypothetical protein
VTVAVAVAVRVAVRVNVAERVKVALLVNDLDTDRDIEKVRELVIEGVGVAESGEGDSETVPVSDAVGVGDSVSTAATKLRVESMGPQTNSKAKISAKKEDFMAGAARESRELSNGSCSCSQRSNSKIALSGDAFTPKFV